MPSAFEDGDLNLGVILKNDLKALAKEKTSLYNRLMSIQEDSQFVEQVCLKEYPKFAVAPNLRCGAWYVDPKWTEIVPDAVYFKSTDGHHGSWDFNLRRANLHLLRHVVDHGGLIVVDSTRKGKRLPDALSKTVPIWCCVVNRAIASKYSLHEFNTELHVPQYSVGPSEKAQIEARLESWVQRLINSTFEIPKLSKPLRPIWITPPVTTFPDFSGHLDFYPVICLSASRQVMDGIERSYGYSYVQGSGDDHEAWSQGLTPSTYWRNKADVAKASPDTVPEVVAEIIARQHTVFTCVRSTPISKVHDLMAVSTAGVATPPPGASAATIYIAEEATDLASSNMLLVCSIPSGKSGQLHFMKAIPSVLSFAKSKLDEQVPLQFVAKETPDTAIGMAMAVLQELFEDKGSYVGGLANRVPTKASIRTRLEWIQESCPGLNPSRATMKRVNEHFMSPPSMRNWRP